MELELETRVDANATVESLFFFQDQSGAGAEYVFASTSPVPRAVLVFCFPLLHSMKYAYRDLLVVAYQSYLVILARKRSPPIPTHPPVVFTMLIH